MGRLNKNSPSFASTVTDSHEPANQPRRPSRNLRSIPLRLSQVKASITFTLGGDGADFRVLACDLYEELQLLRVARRIAPKVAKLWRRYGGG